MSKKFDKKFGMFQKIFRKTIDTGGSSVTVTTKVNQKPKCGGAER